MEKIKLVIWDLDDTFWHGTIAEGEVTINEQALHAVHTLNKRGIVNTIVSKNNFDIVKNKLVNDDLWDRFIMPSVSYEPKGLRIKLLIKNFQLRDVNVLFIDDNDNNLIEAKFYNPNLNTLNASEINNLLELPSMKGKHDPKLSRFNQYKHLETILEDKKTFTSNLEFLQQAQFKLRIINFDKQSLIKYLDRAFEMIDRFNQLNFTKKKVSKEELSKLSDDTKYNSGLVSLNDKYGDYGIIGFFSVDIEKNELIQFVFSCRVLNICVESYIYQYLNSPHIKILGEVAAELSSSKNINWISIDSEKLLTENKYKGKNILDIYFKGGCDLSGMLRYLSKKQKFNIIEDLNYLSDGLDIRSDHSYTIINSKKLSFLEKENLISNIPFIDENTFNNKIFSMKGILILSVVMDYTQYVFKNKFNSIKIAYGPFDFSSTDPMYQKKIISYFKVRSKKINYDFLKYFRKNYEFMGRISPDEFIKNLKLIKSFLKKGTQVILINAAEIPNINLNDPFFESNEEMIERHKIMNKALEKLILKEKNFHLVDVKKFITNSSHLDDSIRHFKISKYNEIASELVNVVNNISSKDTNLSKKIFLFSFIRQLIGKHRDAIKRKLKIN